MIDDRDQSLSALLQEFSMEFSGLPAVTSRGHPRDNHHYSKTSVTLKYENMFTFYVSPGVQGFLSFSEIQTRIAHKSHLLMTSLTSTC